MISSPTTAVETVVTVDLGHRNRGSVFFRPFLIIPALILSGLLVGNSFASDNDEWTGSGVIVAIVLLILFTGRYVSWLLNFVHGVQSFSLKIGVYAFLLRDEYPAVEEKEYAYVLYPEIDGGAKLNRGLPLVKWFLAIPHYIYLAVTGIGVGVVTILAWFAILFTGRYPEVFAGFVVGWLKYYNRVYGYAFAMVSDQYPAFKLA